MESPFARRSSCVFLAIASALTVAINSSAADPTADRAAAEKTIRQSADDFTKAFNAGDAKKIAALWTAGGMMSDETGRTLRGQKAIEDEYTAFFKSHPGAQIEIAIQSIDFPAPNMAVEEGTGIMTFKDGGPTSSSRYSAVHTLQDGKWQMATVREASAQVAPSTADRLQPIAWLIGKWQAKTEKITATSDFHWVANKNFIVRNYDVQSGGTVRSTGVQIIGWDPRSQQPRSWSFDSSGGFGGGVWMPMPDGWRVDSSGVMADGTPTSSRDFVIRVPGDDNVFGWRSTNRMAGGTPLADTSEIVLDRMPDAKLNDKQMKDDKKTNEKTTAEKK